MNDRFAFALMSFIYISRRLACFLTLLKTLTSLPDTCDKTIKLWSKDRIESFNGYLKQCLNDLRAKIYALKCKRRRKFSNQLVNVWAFRTLVFSVGVVMRRKLSKLRKVSFTIIVVSGITSDVGERSSVRWDGICQRKGKLVIQDCRLRKRELKKKQIEQNIPTYLKFLHSQLCQSRKRQWHETLWDFNIHDNIHDYLCPFIHKDRIS